MFCVTQTQHHASHDDYKSLKQNNEVLVVLNGTEVVKWTRLIWKQNEREINRGITFLDTFVKIQGVHRCGDDIGVTMADGAYSCYLGNIKKITKNEIWRQSRGDVVVEKLRMRGREGKFNTETFLLLCFEFSPLPMYQVSMRHQTSVVCLGLRTKYLANANAHWQNLSCAERAGDSFSRA